MAGSASAKAVVTALLGNTFVTAIKLIAFVLSGSGAISRRRSTVLRTRVTSYC